MILSNLRQYTEADLTFGPYSCTFPKTGDHSGAAAVVLTVPAGIWYHPLLLVGD
jgi:hypothetical protein